MKPLWQEEETPKDDKAIAKRTLPKPWEVKLGLIAGNALAEFAKFTRLRPMEIDIIARALLIIKQQIESDAHPKTKYSDGFKPPFTDTDIRDWMGKKYWKVNPVDKSDLESEQRYSFHPKQFELIITDYEISTNSEKASLLVGYERNTATLFTLIHKMKANAQPTFDETSFYGFTQDARAFLAEKVKKSGIPTVIKLLKDDNRTHIEFDEIAETYKNNAGNIFNPSSMCFNPGKGQKILTLFNKAEMSIEVEEIGYKKEIIQLFFKLFEGEALTIAEARSWVSQYVTYMNKTLKTIKKRKGQEKWVDEFIKNIEWKVLDRKG